MTTNDARQAGDADALETALAAIGVHCTVEAHGRLAVLVPSVPQPALAEPAARRRATALAEAHGFSHLALELGEALAS
jgi:hypothetical protein